MARLSPGDRSIAGQVAIVTGAASGMGRATARLFADEGARVGIVDRDAEGLEAVRAELVEAGALVEAVAVDLADGANIPAALEGIRAALGPVDIVVNNAGVSIPVAIDDPAYDAAWDTTLAVNLTAYVRVIRSCLADLRRNAAGRIVNVASTEGLGATAFVSPYTASKHAVIGLTRALAVELGASGVTVNCVCPGPISTGMTSAIPDEAKHRFARRRVPAKRYGAP
jgi:3-oxoacyl-[acyl-carrier protein] reductase